MFLCSDIKNALSITITCCCCDCGSNWLFGEFICCCSWSICCNCSRCCSCCIDVVAVVVFVGDCFCCWSAAAGESCCCNWAPTALANKEVSKNDWRLSAGWHSAAGIWNFLFINDKSSKTGKNKPFLRRNCANASVVEVDIYFHRRIIFVKWAWYRKT